MIKRTENIYSEGEKNLSKYEQPSNISWRKEEQFILRKTGTSAYNLQGNKCQLNEMADL